MLRTIVVIVCEFAIRTLEPLRSDWADRAYWFFEETRAATLMKQTCSDASRESDECLDSRIWLRVADGELRSWCECAEPGKEVLACGHCGCGNSALCWRCVVSGSGLEWRRNDSCGPKGQLCLTRELGLWPLSTCL